jgi:hypothetical protein
VRIAKSLRDCLDCERLCDGTHAAENAGICSPCMGFGDDVTLVDGVERTVDGCAEAVVDGVLQKVWREQESSTEVSDTEMALELKEIVDFAGNLVEIFSARGNASVNHGATWQRAYARARGGPSDKLALDAEDTQVCGGGSDDGRDGGFDDGQIDVEQRGELEDGDAPTVGDDFIDDLALETSGSDDFFAVCGEDESRKAESLSTV